jgi:hypothetical protein
MRHFLLSVLMVLASLGAGAQSVSSEKDTVWVYATGAYHAYDYVTNHTTDTVTVLWEVAATNFPADWLLATGMCDINNCIGDLWPAHTEHPRYPPGTWDFHIMGDLTDVSTDGPYYITVRLRNEAIPTDEHTQTYVVNRNTAHVAYMSRSSGDDAVVVYPNPATNVVNVMFSGLYGVTGIGVYSIIGREMKVYSTADNSAALNIEHLPSGIYFIKLLNAQGYVVATQKFTKQ